MNQAVHAVTKTNIPRYKLQYSKVSQAYVANTIKMVPEKKCIDDQVVIKPTLPNIPQSVASIEKPDEVEMVKLKRTRILTS